MKLKKLLAAVTAAALAVTTMAVTSFTASSLDTSNEAVIGEFFSGSKELTTSGGSIASDGEWSSQWVQLSENNMSNSYDWDKAAADSNAYLKATFSFNTEAAELHNNGSGQAWYSGDIKVGTTTFSTEETTVTAGTDYVAYVLLSSVSLSNKDQWGQRGFNMQACSGDSGQIITLKKAELVILGSEPLSPEDPTGTWIKESAGVYYFKAEAAGSNPDYDAGATKPAALKVPVDEILVLGKTTADIKSITASIECTGNTNGVLGGNTTADGGWTQVDWDGSTNDYVKIENMYDFSDVSFQVNYAEFGDTCKVTFTLEYKESTDGQFEIAVTPETKTIAVGDYFSAAVLVTGTTPELQNVDGSMQAFYDDTIVSVEAQNDTDDGMIYIIEGVGAGTTTVDFEWTPDESTGIELETPLIGSCDVTVTDGTTPPEVTVTVSPSTAKIKVGETTKLTAAVTGKDDAVVTWEANKDQAGDVVVEVAADGTVTGKKAGTVEVWALVDGKRIDSNTSFSVVTVEADAPPAGTVGEWSENNGTFTYTHGSEGSGMDNKGIPIEKFELTESDKANAVEISAHVKVDGFWKVKLGINGTDGWKEAPAQEITDEGDIVLSINGIAADNLLIQTEWINGDTKVEVSDLKIKLADGTVKPYGGSTPNPPVDPTYTLTPATATVKIGLNNGQVFTLEGYTATEQIAWDIDSAYAAKYVGSDNGLENNQCKIVGIAVGGPVTLTAKSLDGDVLGTATITFTDSTTPDHTHTPANTWSSDATGHWHTCSGCSEKLDFVAHTSDGGTVTTPATETTAGTKTYKCTECGYVIKTETIPATGTGDKPTPPAPWVPHPGVSAPVVPTTGANNSSLPTVNGQNGWEAVSAEIITSSDGDKILVEMNSATKVPSTILGDLEGKDVDVVFNMGRGITWTVNGLSITNRKTIDFDISKNTRHIPDEVVDNAEGSHKKQISLDHKGTFGCTAALTYEVGTKYNGLYANLFYYNPKTEQLEFADCSLVSGGKAKFTFTHASDYLITISDEPLGEFEDVSSAAGIASDSSVIVNETAIGAVLAVIVLGFGIIVYRKRRHN